MGGYLWVSCMFVSTLATHSSLILTKIKQKGKVMEKSPIFIGVASPMNGYVGVGLARGKEHTRQRKALAPALSKNALYGQEEIIQRHISALLAALRRKIGAGEVANMSDYCMFVSFFLCGLVHGVERDTLLTWFFCCYRFIHHIRCHWRTVLWRAIWLSRSRLGDGMGQIYHSCDGVCHI